MLVADSETGEIRRLFGDPTATNFPVPGAGGPEIPRDATFVITRKDGGIVGS